MNIYDKPSYVGASVLDLSKLHMMNCNSDVSHATFESRYNLIYSDTDSLVYDIRHLVIYDWARHNREHFDLSDSKRFDPQDDANKGRGQIQSMMGFVKHG